MQIERCPDIKYGINTSTECVEFSSNFALLVVTVGSWYHTVLLRSEGIGMRCYCMCNCTQSHPFHFACKGQGRVPRSSLLCASNNTLVIVLCWGMGIFQNKSALTGAVCSSGWHCYKYACYRGNNTSIRRSYCGTLSTGITNILAFTFVSWYLVACIIGCLAQPPQKIAPRTVHQRTHIQPIPFAYVG